MLWGAHQEDLDAKARGWTFLEVQSQTSHKCCLKVAWMQKQGKQGVNFGARGEDLDAKARGELSWKFKAKQTTNVV